MNEQLLNQLAGEVEIAFTNCAISRCDQIAILNQVLKHLLALEQAEIAGVRYIFACEPQLVGEA